MTTEIKTNGQVDSHEGLLKSKQVMKILGGISNQTLWRYCNNSTLGFPSPIWIMKVRYWEKSEILDFIKAQRNTPPPKFLLTEKFKAK